MALAQAEGSTPGPSSDTWLLQLGVHGVQAHVWLQLSRTGCSQLSFWGGTDAARFLKPTCGSQLRQLGDCSDCLGEEVQKKSKLLFLLFGFSKSQLVLYLKKKGLENTDIIYFKNNCLQSFFTFIYIYIYILIFGVSPESVPDDSAFHFKLWLQVLQSLVVSVKQGSSTVLVTLVFAMTKYPTGMT